MVPVLQGLGNEERKPGALMNEGADVGKTGRFISGKCYSNAMYTVLQKDQIWEIVCGEGRSLVC